MALMPPLSLQDGALCLSARSHFSNDEDCFLIPVKWKHCEYIVIGWPHMMDRCGRRWFEDWELRMIDIAIPLIYPVRVEESLEDSTLRVLLYIEILSNGRQAWLQVAHHSLSLSANGKLDGSKLDLFDSQSVV